MKSLLKAFSVLALSGAMVMPVLADDATAPADAKDQKDLKKVIEDQGINYVETAQKGITLSGYVDTSYTEQFGGRGTAFTGAQADLHQFDVNNNSFNINAVKVALEKALPDKNEWAAGFRIDTIYGQDAKILNGSDPVLGGGSISPGDGTSGSNGSSFYLEQALVKFRIPVGNGLDIYAGKFVTLLGYEVIESPANLNFSRGLLFTNAIPLTNTGVYADYKFNDTFEAKFGIVDGWNQSDSTPNTPTTTGADHADDYPFGGKAITGQLNINAPGKNANITQSFIYSPSGEPNNSGAGFAGIDNGPIAVYDIWGNWNPTFVKDSALTLGFNVDFGYNGASGSPSNTQPVGLGEQSFPTTGVSDSNTWYGVALYSSYKVSKLITLSARGEYLHEDSAVNPKFGTAGVSNDDFSETLTAAFNVWDNLLTRVEYRYDHLTNGSTGSTGAANNVATFTNQDEVSVEAVYSF
ncbi:porin [Methylacidiphilales bacterium]|nr:porin [Candidatus Methylacidiphilales bacterium]